MSIYEPMVRQGVSVPGLADGGYVGDVYRGGPCTMFFHGVLTYAQETTLRQLACS